jgi:hypothetical protein
VELIYMVKDHYENKKTVQSLVDAFYFAYGVDVKLITEPQFSNSVKDVIGKAIADVVSVARQVDMSGEICAKIARGNPLSIVLPEYGLQSRLLEVSTRLCYHVGILSPTGQRLLAIPKYPSPSASAPHQASKNESRSLPTVKPSPRASAPPASLVSRTLLEEKYLYRKEPVNRTPVVKAPMSVINVAPRYNAMEVSHTLVLATLKSSGDCWTDGSQLLATRSPSGSVYSRRYMCMFIAVFDAMRAKGLLTGRLAPITTPLHLMYAFLNAGFELRKLMHSMNEREQLDGLAELLDVRINTPLAGIPDGAGSVSNPRRIDLVLRSNHYTVAK